MQDTGQDGDLGAPVTKGRRWCVGVHRVVVKKKKISVSPESQPTSKEVSQRWSQPTEEFGSIKFNTKQPAETVPQSRGQIFYKPGESPALGQRSGLKGIVAPRKKKKKSQSEGCALVKAWVVFQVCHGSQPRWDSLVRSKCESDASRQTRKNIISLSGQEQVGFPSKSHWF